MKERSSGTDKAALNRKAAPIRTNKRNKKGKKRIALYVIEGILLLIVLFFTYLYSLTRKINIDEDIKPEDLTTNEVAPEVEEVMKGYLNIAFFGVDARDNTTLGAGTHADSNMICSINLDTGTVKLISIYRDSYLNIKGEDTFNKLTQAYFEGGAAQSINTLNKNLDLNITEYVTVNWKAVADAINILGGIDVDITKAEFTQINGYITATHETTGIPTSHLRAPGPNHLDGVQAVAYARLRKMDDDYKRAGRQRLVIELALQKAKQADLLTLNKVMNTVFPQIKTSLDQGEIFNLVKNITKYNIVESTGFPFDKTSKMMGKRGDCVIPLGLAQNVKQLHEFLFETEQYTPSKTVLRLDQLIKNATGLGDPGTNPKPTAPTPKPTATVPSTDSGTQEGSSPVEEGNTDAKGNGTEQNQEVPSGAQDNTEDTLPAESDSPESSSQATEPAGGSLPEPTQTSVNTPEPSEITRPVEDTADKEER